MSDGQTFVIKQVLCASIKEANEALKEAKDKVTQETIAPKTLKLLKKAFGITALKGETQDVKARTDVGHRRGGDGANPILHEH